MLVVIKNILMFSAMILFSVARIMYENDVIHRSERNIAIYINGNLWKRIRKYDFVADIAVVLIFAVCILLLVIDCNVFTIIKILLTLCCAYCLYLLSTGRWKKKKRY